ncbi:anchor protein [Opitutaceae bacterium TAV5]|nr:anchor protein [Opitutaceae bacterium TAV5]
MKNKMTEYLSITAARRARFACVSLFLLSAAGMAHAANIDTYWNVADGEWTSAGNWSNGLPGDLSPDVSRVFFDTAQSGTVSNVTVAASAVAAFNQFRVNQGKTVNVSMGAGASLSGVSLTLGSGAASSHLRIEGPSDGTATASWSSFLQVGGTATSSGNTLTFSGSGLAASAANTITIGRQGNSHTMTVEGGASFQGKGLVVSGTTDVQYGVGNNNRLIVSGTGTNMTLSGFSGAVNTLGLVVGARPLTGSSGSNVQSGNRVTVSDGARLTVVGDNVDNATMTVLVGAATYRTNNSIEVSGTDSVFEVTGNIRTTVGHTTDTSYNNRLTVSDGGTVKTDAEIVINNGPSTAANRRNILAIGNGGTLVSDNVINNNGGLVTLAEGGVLKGETLAGAATSLVLNINGTGRFEAAGNGLGDTVTVNIGDSGGKEAVLAVGLAGRSGAATFSLDSALNLATGSFLEVSIFSDGSVDSIDLGTNASVTLSDGVGLRIAFDGEAPSAGGSYQLFTGNLSSIVGSFDTDLLSAPALADGLSWDWSRFNAAGGWTVSVVPEPSVIALLAGAGTGLVALGIRLRRRGEDNA